MKTARMGFALRVFALVGLLAVNWVVPTKAAPEDAGCWSCHYGWCWEVIEGAGVKECAPDYENGGCITGANYCMIIRG